MLSNQKPPRSAGIRARFVWINGETFRGLELVAFQAPVERAAAQAEFLGGLARVAVAAGEGLLDQERFDLLEAHVLETRGGVSRVETEIGCAHDLGLRHE